MSKPPIPTPHAVAAAPAQRRHDLDALRVLVFGLLILYHVGMGYVADWGWHVKSGHAAEWLQGPMMLVNRWRMPLLFWASAPRRWLSRRSARSGCCCRCWSACCRCCAVRQ